MSPAVLRETLRLAPTAPLRTVAPLEDTTLKGGKYAVPKDMAILVNVFVAHRDPLVWGPDVSHLNSLLRKLSQFYIMQAEEFKPERMLDGKFEALPVFTRVTTNFDVVF